MTAMIEFSDASRLYRNKRGLNRLNLTVREGEVVGLLGANGSGKTTLLKIAAGLLRPDTGSVRIGGFDVYEDPVKALSGVGALIETPALYGKLSARDNLRVAAKYLGLKSEVKIDRALEWAGLEARAKDKAGKLSLGMRQRLALAIAFLGEKKLLLLDEPTNGLDIESAAGVKELIRKAACENGAAVIVSSHMTAELEKISSRVVVLSEGNVLADAPIHEALREGKGLEEFYISVRRGEKA